MLRTNPRLPSSLWAWQIGIPRAKELVFTGDIIPAERALAIGLVNHVVPRDELETFTHAIAMRVALGASKRVQKEWLNEILTTSLGLSAAMETVYRAWEPEVSDEVQEAWGAQLCEGGVGAAVQWRRDRWGPYELHRNISRGRHAGYSARKSRHQSAIPRLTHLDSIRPSIAGQSSIICR